MTDDTRARILHAALEEFSVRGYHETSVRELADRVGVTKTAVLYHFPGKADIVTALAEPMLADFEAALAEAAEAPDPSRAVVEGLLGVWLTHRTLLRMNLRDLGLTASAEVFERFRDGMLQANALVAGPEADFAGRVRAAQAIAMLSDPVVLFAEAPEADLRTAILDGVARLLTPPARDGNGGPDAVEIGAVGGKGADGDPADAAETPADVVETSVIGAKSTDGAPAVEAAPVESVPSGPPSTVEAADGKAGPAEPAAVRRKSRRGRPPAMSPETVEAARRLYDAGRAPSDIAAALGVSRATIYRHLPAD